MPSESLEPRADGRFSDGKTAAAIDVGVHLGERGVEILVPGAESLVWPYAGLTAGEPLTPHAIDVLLNSEITPGATLFVADTQFARRLGTRAPHLVASSVRWGHARPWVWATGAVAAASTLLWLFDLSPSNAIARLLPEQARTALGNEVVSSMTAGRRVCEAREGRAALDRLTERLARAAGHARFNVVVVDWVLFNAFAVPGEQIVLTRGLIAKAANSDEVAGVLAHEMGHGLEMHPETALVRALGLSAAAELMFGGSGGAMTNIGIVLAQLSYTRAAEHAADVHALAILERAGISAEGLAGFFERVSELEGQSAIGAEIAEIDILRTHPLAEERRRLAESAPRYPATPAMTDDDWAALKVICRAEGESDS